MGHIITVLLMVNLLIISFGKYTKKRIVASLIVVLVTVVFCCIESLQESRYIFLAILCMLTAIVKVKRLKEME